MMLFPKARWLPVLAGAALVLLSFIAACVPAELEPAGAPIQVTRASATPDLPQPSPSPTPPQTPDMTLLSQYPTVTPWETYDPDASPTPYTPRPDWTPPTPTPVPAFPGLVYSTGEGLWLMGEDWQPSLLTNRPDALLSPDTREALFIEQNDIWWQDLASGEQRNLTSGSGNRHCCPQWVPGRPGTIIFGSQPLDSDSGPSSGFLTTVQTDGSGYQVLDPGGESNGGFTPGPDGRVIAYDRAGSSWLYRWDGGPEAIDPAQYGIANVSRIAGPSWSPEGRYLAWTAAVTNPDWRIALVVLDLTSETGWLLHPYENIGRGGWFDPPAWSPDGEWLAFVAEDINPARSGVWVAAADGSEEIQLFQGQKPFWSRDGRWLMYTGTGTAATQDQDHINWLVEAESWFALRMFLPDGGMAVTWR